MTIHITHTVVCDMCSKQFRGTVKAALFHRWTRVGGPSGGGSVLAKHYCSDCSKERRAAYSASKKANRNIKTIF